MQKRVQLGIPKKVNRKNMFININKIVLWSTSEKKLVTPEQQDFYFNTIVDIPGLALFFMFFPKCVV